MDLGPLDIRTGLPNLLPALNDAALLALSAALRAALAACFARRWVPRGSLTIIFFAFLPACLNRFCAFRSPCFARSLSFLTAAPLIPSTIATVAINTAGFLGGENLESSSRGRSCSLRLLAIALSSAARSRRLRMSRSSCLARIVRSRCRSPSRRWTSRARRASLASDSSFMARILRSVFASASAFSFSRCSSLFASSSFRFLSCSSRLFRSASLRFLARRYNITPITPPSKTTIPMMMAGLIYDIVLYYNFHDQSFMCGAIMFIFDLFPS